MPFDKNLLTSHAECDEATAELDAELDTLQHRDDTIAYHDRQDGRVATKTASRLAVLGARIASYTTTLAQPDLDATTRRTVEDQLLTATYQKTKLTNRAAARTGAAAFLADVDAEQVARQVAALTEAKALVATRRAELPA